MTALNNGTADGTNMVQQPCTGSSGQIYRFQSAGSGIWRLFHPASGRCVSAAGGGGNNYVIELRACDSSTLRQWNVTTSGSYYTLPSVASGGATCLDVYFAQTNDGAEYETYTCNGDQNQQFRFISP
jgi:glucosylceramidase